MAKQIFEVGMTAVDAVVKVVEENLRIDSNCGC